MDNKKEKLNFYQWGTGLCGWVAFWTVISPSILRDLFPSPFSLFLGLGGGLVVCIYLMDIAKIFKEHYRRIN